MTKTFIHCLVAASRDNNVVKIIFKIEKVQHQDAGLVTNTHHQTICINLATTTA